MCQTYERNDLSWLSDESVCQLFVEGDEMANIDIAKVLLEENVLADLISSRELIAANKSRNEN